MRQAGRKRWVVGILALWLSLAVASPAGAGGQTFPADNLVVARVICVGPGAQFFTGVALYIDEIGTHYDLFLSCTPDDPVDYVSFRVGGLTHVGFGPPGSCPTLVPGQVRVACTVPVEGGYVVFVLAIVSGL